MTIRQIKCHTTNGQIRYTLAIIYGECAVHRSLGINGWGITHLNSCKELASYSSLKVASQYAMDVQKWIDLDQFAIRLTEDVLSYETLATAVFMKKRMLHECFLYRESDVLSIEKIAPGWIKKHPNNKREGDGKSRVCIAIERGDYDRLSI